MLFLVVVSHGRLNAAFGSMNAKRLSYLPAWGSPEQDLFLLRQGFCWLSG